jgi:signal transduction histidine kinase
VPSLFVIQGRDQGRRFELGESSLGIGRDPANQIRLNDTEVSRRHAELRQSEDGYLWIDRESSNGSFINSVRVDQHRLRSGDRVQIGRTLMIYTDSSSPPAQVTPHEVDIVGQSDSQRDSRIIHAVSQAEGSHLFTDAQTQLSPWLARARSNLQVMYRTALAVSHTMDIDQLLQRIMELIFEWVEADRGCVMLVDRDTDELVPKVRRDRKRQGAGETISISRTILDYVRTSQEGVLTSDARDDQRWDPAASILKMGVREAICVPMQGRYGIVGVIYIDTFTPPGQLLQQTGPPKRFSDEHLKLMVAIGHQAALAVEDTSYYSAMLQAERLAAMGQTIAGLSHHVKNILQGIRGGSFLIQEGLKAQDWEVTRKGWDIVERNQERISNLVMDMLTFSKERQPDMVSSDLNQIVGDVLELMQARAAELGVEIVDRRRPDIPRMTFDPEALHRAILNVVTNALDACAARGDEDQAEAAEAGSAPLRVEVASDYDAVHGRLRVTVRDNGVGIPAEQIKRVFSIFVSNKGQRGTGLGLPVSQKILQEHGGEILVESEPGQGSCFTLQWPAMVAESTGTVPLE